MLQSLKYYLYRLKKRLFPKPAHFSEEHFQNRVELEKDYKVLAQALMDYVPFETAYDVGCANGFLIDQFQREGHSARGIEVSAEVKGVLPGHLKPLVDIGDFSEAAGTYDLVCCVEVAEHIKPRRSIELVETLASLADSYIYFTAAPPGQPGHGHINCRPHAFWLEQFAKRGWALDDERTQQLRSRLQSVEIADWLEGNSFILRAENGV